MKTKENIKKHVIHVYYPYIEARPPLMSRNAYNYKCSILINFTKCPVKSKHYKTPF